MHTTTGSSNDMSVLETAQQTEWQTVMKLKTAITALLMLVASCEAVPHYY